MVCCCWLCLVVCPGEDVCLCLFDAVVVVSCCGVAVVCCCVCVAYVVFGLVHALVWFMCVGIVCLCRVCVRPR